MVLLRLLVAEMGGVEKERRLSIIIYNILKYQSLANVLALHKAWRRLGKSSVQILIIMSLVCLSGQGVVLCLLIYARDQRTGSTCVCTDTADLDHQIPGALLPRLMQRLEFVLDSS